MKKPFTVFFVGIAACLSANAQTNPPVSTESPTQTVETVVCIRHGEKPADALGQLTCRGLNRALALPKMLLAKYGTPQFIFAPNPTEKADQEKNKDGYFYVRPLATIEPTAIRCGLPVNTQFGFSDIHGLENELQKPEYRNATIFVAWEHLKLVDFVKAMVNDHGADPGDVKAWPHKDYDTIYVVKITRSPGHELVTFTVDHENLNDLSDTCPEITK